MSKNIGAESKNFQVKLRQHFREKFSNLYRMQFYWKLPNIFALKARQLILPKKFPWTRWKKFWHMFRIFFSNSKKSLLQSEKYYQNVPPANWIEILKTLAGTFLLTNDLSN